MKTIGTANLHLLTDAALLSYIAATALDVYEAVAVFQDGPMVDFALATMRKFTDERDRRAATAPTQKVGFLG